MYFEILTFTLYLKFLAQTVLEDFQDGVFPIVPLLVKISKNTVWADFYFEGGTNDF